MNCNELSEDERKENRYQVNQIIKDGYDITENISVIDQTTQRGKLIDQTISFLSRFYLIFFVSKNKRRKSHELDHNLSDRKNRRE